MNYFKISKMIFRKIEEKDFSEVEKEQFSIKKVQPELQVISLILFKLSVFSIILFRDSKNSVNGFLFSKDSPSPKKFQPILGLPTMDLDSNGDHGFFSSFKSPKKQPSDTEIDKVSLCTRWCQNLDFYRRINLNGILMRKLQI